MVWFRKIFAAILAFFQVILMNMGFLKPTQLSADVPQLSRSISAVSVADHSTNPLADSVEYAQSIKNVVQCAYVDSLRSAYKITNGQVSLTHMLKGVEKYATLTDKNGSVYIADSFRSFYTDKLGFKHYFETSKDPGRVNTIRLGAYYYDCHVRDFTSDTFMVDKGYHVFADRLYMEYALLSKTATTAFKGFGSEIKMPVKDVAALQIADKNGIHSEITETDPQSVEYAAFDISGVGVVAFIVPSDGSTASVQLTKCGANYVLTQNAVCDGSGLNKYDETGGYEKYKLTFGCRIYTDSTHTFAGAAEQAYIERHPLTVSVIGGDSTSASLGYNALRGTYDVHMDSTGFNYPYENPDFRYTAKLKIEADAYDRDICLRTTSDSGCLEAAALLDENDTLVAIDAEVCKNFKGDGGEEYYSYTDYAYGDSFIPLRVRKNTDLRCTALNIYQNWGKYPIKQISSIEFHTSYYHMSTGTTESNCIAPYFVYGRDGWTLPDFRNRSGNMWATQPQFNSVGILKFVTYRDSSVKEPVVAEFCGSTVESRGLAYSDVKDCYVSDSGKFTYSLRHVEFPQVDENRTYYTVQIDFTDDISFDNFKTDFDLFYFDGRFVRFCKTGFLGADNKPVRADVTPGTTYHTLGSDHPYYGFYKVADDTDAQIDKGFGCNFALLVKNSKMIIGGKETAIPFVFREAVDDKTTSGALTLDTEQLSFKKGDSITLDLILLPWGVGRETTDDNVLAVREDSALHPAVVTAQTGAVRQDAYLPTVCAENGKAQFTVTGGKGNIAVRVDGFTSMQAPKIYTVENGQKTPYETASVLGYDGYTVHANDDGTYSFSFVYTSAGVTTPYTFCVEQ